MRVVETAEHVPQQSQKLLARSTGVHAWSERLFDLNPIKPTCVGIVELVTNCGPHGFKNFSEERFIVSLGAEN